MVFNILDDILIRVGPVELHNSSFDRIVPKVWSIIDGTAGNPLWFNGKKDQISGISRPYLGLEIPPIWFIFLPAACRLLHHWRRRLWRQIGYVMYAWITCLMKRLCKPTVFALIFIYWWTYIYVLVIYLRTWKLHVCRKKAEPLDYFYTIIPHT